MMTVNTRRLAVVLLVAALLTAGAGWLRHSLADPGAGKDGGLELAARFSAHPASPAAGEGTTFSLEVTNRTSRPLPLLFNTSQEFDLVIAQGQATVWRWSDNKVFLQVIVERDVAAGRSLSYQVRWDGKDGQGNRLPPGTYTVTAQFRGQGAQVDIPPLELVIR